MKFTKNTARFLIVDAIVLAVFNVIAFVLPFNRLAGFWTGYSFASFAIVFTAIVGLYAFAREGMRSKFLGMPLAFVVWAYLLAQLAVSLVEMAVPAIPVQYPIALNVILLAVALIALIAADAGKEEVERLDAKVKAKVFFIKSLQGDVESLASSAADANLKKSLKALSDAIRFSDPMSAPELAPIESSIEAKVSALRDAAGSDSGAAIALCAEIERLVGDRNRKCKLLK
jgi:hypothetical protein